MTIQEASKTLIKLYETAKDIEYIDNPVLWALRQTLTIEERQNSKKAKQTTDNCEVVKKWRNDNPLGKKIECARATGLSRPTVDKYWEV